MEEVRPGIYQHFKGEHMLYEVVATAIHTETNEELVVYKSLYDSPEFPINTWFVRPKKMFLETVERDGKVMPRFKYLG